ncbi:MAG: hypothetical protein ACTSPD_10360 [Promethearchaeota archaeon]
MYHFKIYHIKSLDKIYKCIQLTSKMGGEKSNRNGITCLVFDILLNNRKLKYQVSYYHDGYPEKFLHLAIHWLNSWYIACEEKHYMWQNMSFCPTLEPHKIIKTETKRIENYDKLKKFLKEFFNA